MCECVCACVIVCVCMCMNVCVGGGGWEWICSPRICFASTKKLLTMEHIKALLVTLSNNQSPLYIEFQDKTWNVQTS